MSEYQRSYTPFRSRSVSPQRSVPVAGIRSKQRGVSREPQLPSRKKSVMFRPQMSAIWAPSGVVSRRQGAQQEASPERRPPAPLTAPPQPVSPRPRPSEPHSQSQPPTPLTASNGGQQPVANGTQCVLRRKAGLRSAGERSKLRRSEYHRQFTWKTAKHAGSPLLNAQQVLYSSSRVIPPFKKNPVAMETEYRRSFQCQTPPRGPRLRKHLERKRREVPEVKPRPQQEQDAPPPQSPQKTTPPPHAADEDRMPKTVYLSNFRSPILTDDNQRDSDQGYSWYKEVQELREKAASYRRRAWGTHFSRNHLNQLLSEYNSLWEASDTLTDTHSDTLTDTRSDTLTDTHASEPGCNVAGDPDDEEDDDDDADVRTSSSGSQSVQPLDLARVSSSSSVSSKSGSADKSHTRTDKNTQLTHTVRKVQRAHSVENSPRTHTDKHTRHAHSDKHTQSNTAICPGLPVSRRLAWGETEPTDENEGRLPTPTLKVRPVQRTHHDRTTPATGGAILVSPPKQTGKTDPPLGKPQSPFKHMGLQQTGVAAGMATVDPLPLREEGAWLEDSPTPKPSTRSTPNRRSSSKPMRMKQGPPVLPPHRIQGTLRDPEFQHNGELGCRIPGAGCGSDEDDRFSVLSWRSAASCSKASEVLERTQRRRDKFWGKK